MAKAASPIPKGYHSITSTLTCSDAAEAIDFYKKAFGAEEVMRSNSPDGKVSHAELKIGDSIIFVNDEFPGMNLSHSTSGTPPYGIFLYTPDVDAVFARAVAAGARVEMPMEDMFWGDRFGKITDPFGHQWALAMRVEDLTREETNKRAAAFFAKFAAQKS